MAAPKRDPDMNERATIPRFGTRFNDMRHKYRFSRFAFRSSRSAGCCAFSRQLSAVSWEGETCGIAIQPAASQRLQERQQRLLIRGRQRPEPVGGFLGFSLVTDNGVARSAEPQSLP